MKDLASLTLTELSKLPTKDLLELYNAHAPKPIERFADHFSGFKRTKAIWLSLKGDKKPEVALTAKPITEKPVANLKPRTGDERRKKARCNVLVAPLNKPTDTKEYHSVLAAFKALGLPLVKHQRFRRELKLAGKATFAELLFTATY